MHITRHIFLLIVVAFLATACGKKGSDSVILSESTMIDVLYDYQFAVALAAEGAAEGQQAELEYKYVEAVYAKHHITRQQFDMSLAHYARNPKTLIEITEKVSKRLTQDLQEDEKVQTAASVADAAHSRDTITYFNLPKGYVLNANELNRRVIAIDGRQIKDVERVQLTFESRWLYREGSKNICVITSLKCSGDSTVRETQNIHDYEPRHTVTVDIPRSSKVEGVTFDVCQSTQWQSYPQIFSMYNVKVCGIKSATSNHAR